MALNDGIHFAKSVDVEDTSDPSVLQRIDEKSPASTSSTFCAVEPVLERTPHEGDLSKRQEFKGRTLFWLVFQSIGVIYGDIGTSPLYVYSSTFTSAPSRDDLLGALSLIIWTLTLIVSVKYVFIILRADDEGQGGTFAVYSLLSRYANIVRRDPREESMIKMERVKTQEISGTSKSTRSLLERSTILKTSLKVIGVFGVSLVMSDGILTPAQSVLGAIQGLRIINESISTATIVGTSCTILVLLFLIQPLGTSKIGGGFAPVVIIWLIFNLSFGIYNLVLFDGSVLKAFSPYFAGSYLVRNKTDGWKSLGGILLAFTGVEALFADLGAFSRHSVQLSWLCFGYPCLLLAYIGQAAYISHDAEAYSNPFFNSVPPGMFYPSLVIAVLAAIVASQTMVTATFQLLSQIIKLSYFPQIKVVHTSKIFHHQIYIPWVNWLLMIGTIAVTAAYNNTTKLGQAYGVCVILVTFITTCMVSLVALIIWRLPLYVVLPGFLVFGALDGLYLSSALTKVPDGAWFTLLLSVLLSSIFVLWRFGKERQWAAEAGDCVALSHLVAETDVGAAGATTVPGMDAASNGVERWEKKKVLRLALDPGASPLTRLKGMGVFFDKSGHDNTAPAVFIQFLQKFGAVPEVVVFFHIRPVSKPTVSIEDRFSVAPCFTLQGGNNNGKKKQLSDFYAITVRHGYMDEVVLPTLGQRIYEELRSFIVRYNSTNSSSTSPHNMVDDVAANNDDKSLENDLIIQAQLAALQEAYHVQLVYIIGKSQLRIVRPSRYTRSAAAWMRTWARQAALAAFLWLRTQTGTRVRNMQLEIEKMIEVGFVKTI